MLTFRLACPTAAIQVFCVLIIGLLLAVTPSGPDRITGAVQLPVQKPAPAPEPAVNVPTPRSFPKWTGVVRRTWARHVAWSEVCAARLGRTCRLDTWQDFLKSLSKETRWEQLVRVNRFVNQFRYRPDQANWGAFDYWAAPGEFFASGGDCEDYAIAKYFSLKALGFPAEQMRIVVLNDTNRRLAHAVLVVDIGPYELVLDSLNRRIRLWSEVLYYRPIYWINESAWQLTPGRNISI